MNNVKYTAREMRKQRKVIEYDTSPISDFWNEVNSKLEKCVNYSEDYQTIIIDVMQHHSQPIYNNKELKQAMKELKKAGFQVTDCETFIFIEW